MVALEEVVAVFVVAVLVVVLVAVVVGATDVAVEVETVEVVGSALVVAVVMLVVVAVVLVVVVVEPVVALALLVVFCALVVGENSVVDMELIGLLQAAVSMVAPPAAIKARNLRRVISLCEYWSPAFSDGFSIGLFTLFILSKPPCYACGHPTIDDVPLPRALFFYYCSGSQVLAR